MFTVLQVASAEEYKTQMSFSRVGVAVRGSKGSAAKLWKAVLLNARD